METKEFCGAVWPSEVLKRKGEIQCLLMRLRNLQWIWAKFIFRKDVSPTSVESFSHLRDQNAIAVNSETWKSYFPQPRLNQAARRRTLRVR
jgi:hypothetical protein